MGYRVTMLEANEQLGGRGAVWERDGFSFDAGPTVITAPYLFDELFEMAGRDAKDYFTLKPVDPFYRVRFDDCSSRSTRIRERSGRGSSRATRPVR